MPKISKTHSRKFQIGNVTYFVGTTYESDEVPEKELDKEAERASEFVILETRRDQIDLVNQLQQAKEKPKDA